MSARVENLTERLRVVVSEIKMCESKGQDYTELLEEKNKLEADLRKARSLLVEGTEAKVLRG
jgi:hypothetical protein